MTNKGIRDRMKYICTNERFQDVIFNIGPSRFRSRSNSVFSSAGTAHQKPPIPRNTTNTNATILKRSSSINEHQQRYLSSVIAQASGQISRRHHSPTNSSEIDVAEDERDKNYLSKNPALDDLDNVEERARRLTDLLLSAQVGEGLLDPPIISSRSGLTSSSGLSSSPSSSEGDMGGLVCDPTMGQQSDIMSTSDIDTPRSLRSAKHSVDEMNSCTQTPSELAKDKAMLLQAAKGKLFTFLFVALLHFFSGHGVACFRKWMHAYLFKAK